MVEASLYFHIPFCRKKCGYCHFYVLRENEEQKEALLEGFERELALRSKALAGKKIVSLYFGGGTPSLFGPERLARLLKQLPRKNCEVTLEANPENVDRPLMEQYAEAGINRISLGVQSFDDPLLKTLTREHSAEEAREAVFAIHEAGISDISIDLMYELPGQTLPSWERTLESAASLPISHLSLYNLTFEPQTSFFRKKETLFPMLPPERERTEMYKMAVERLEAGGLRQYEISAFSREGRRSRHNIGYWTARPFLGLGPSAFSYWEGARFRNCPNLSRYCKQLGEEKLPVDFEEKLPPERRQRELLALRLRLLEGVEAALAAPLKKEMEHLCEEGLLSLSSGRYALTSKGVLFYDTVAAALI